MTDLVGVDQMTMFSKLGGVLGVWEGEGALIKKKRKFSSYIRKFRVEQLQSHI